MLNNFSTRQIAHTHFLVKNTEFDSVGHSVKAGAPESGKSTACIVRMAFDG